MIPFELERDGNKVTGRLEIDSDGIAVYFDGYGVQSMEPSFGAPIWIEVGDDGHPSLHAWTDIKDETIGEKISFAKAFECHPVGTKLKAKVGFQVDEDDDGRKRWAEPFEDATIEALNTSSEDGRFINYGVGFPRTGAFGFYDADEIEKLFTR